MEHITMHLLRCGLHGTEAGPGLPEQIDAGTWEQVLTCAGRQGVSAVLWDVVQHLPAPMRPPRETMLRWAAGTDRIEKEYAHRFNVLEELTAFYAAHWIPLLLLKGAGLASLYPTPAHRPCGDIDIWLYGRQAEADELVRRELGIAVSNDVHHHTVFLLRGVMIENHFDFLNLWSHRSNRALERDMHRFAEQQGGTLTVGAQRVHLPSPDLNALFLMRHMAVHFAAVEIGLRHIADWAMFLQADGDKVDWPAIRTIYRAHNMDRFADAVTALCVDRLGIRPPKNYAYENDRELQESILRETLAPAFAEKHPEHGFLKSVSFKVRRWWANRWKHRLVYRDTLAGSFLWLCWAHIIKPRTIAK